MPGKNHKILSPDEVREITIRKPKLTQKEQVFLYMCEHGSITPMQAVTELGCMRLAARIADLERLGFAITHNQIEVRNRFGRKVRVASYQLQEEQS